MVLIKHNSVKFFNPIFIPGFSGSRFTGSRFLESGSRVQSPVPGSRVQIQGPGSGSRVQGAGPGSTSRL